MKTRLALMFVMVLAVGLAVSAGPYLSFEQSLLPTGMFMPSCEATIGFDYSLGGFYDTPGAVDGEWISRELIVDGDFYVTTPDLWSMVTVTIGHELNLGWPHVGLDLVTEVDLGLAALSADLTLTGIVADWFSIWGKVEGTYSPLTWGLEPFIGAEFRW